MLHYGCAGLKQSDHRPVVALLEVEVRRVDAARRRATFERLVQQAGPPDASVLLTVRKKKKTCLAGRRLCICRINCRL